MQTFVVRVYRCQEEHPRQLIGVVEEPGERQALAFTNIEELWGILRDVLPETDGEASGPLHLSRR